MLKRTLQTEIAEYNDITDLPAEDAALLQQARNNTQHAYAPYSNFHVSAFARFVNGKTLGGTNQENAAFPAGICAERSLLAAAGSLYPNMGIDTMAITYQNMNGHSGHPISPCGICRQTLAEFQSRTSHPIRLILSGMEGKVIVVEDAAGLLPLMFHAADMEAKS